MQPHYDDNDIGAGGTLARLGDAGAVLTYLTVTDDLVGVLDAELSDEAARAQLRDEQAEAARAIGVGNQIWLNYPDAGDWDYFALRKRLVAEIRRFGPDFVLTVDPWLPYESHPDHLRVGRACAEAVMLQSLPRFASDPEVDAAFEPRDVTGIGFYFTREPNTVVDISATRERKHRAIDAYRAQFRPEALALLHRGLETAEREWAREQAFEFGEGLKVLRPGHLHVNLDPGV